MNSADMKLVKGLQEGDRQAHLNLISRFRDKAHFFLLGRLKSDDEAVFVATESYIALIEKLKSPDFDPDQYELLDLLVWGIIKNKMKAHRHQLHRNRRRIISAEFSELERFGSHESINEFRLDEEIIKSKALSVLEALPPHYKQAFHMRYIQDLEIAEISERMNVEPQRIYEYISYATQKIRRVFAKKNLFSLLIVILCWRWG